MLKSQIGKNQIINNSFPDPFDYNTISGVVAYDNDPELAVKTLVDATSKLKRYPGRARG
jgi:hypothetical protein